MEEGWDFESSPPSFKQVQPLLLTLFSLSGTGWLINYVTTIRTAYRDRTPGVSLVALTNNLAWELVFAILHPPPLPVAKAILRSWLFVDIFVIYTTAKFARASSSSSNAPLLHRDLHFFVLFGILGFFSGHWALSVLLSPIKAFYWSGMMCLVVMSGTALGILVQRGHTRGMSYGMWLSRFIGSIFAVASLFLRSTYWPQVWGWSDNILMRWFSGAFVVLDGLYGVCFWYTRRVEQRQRDKVD
ncbi:hypothetical protein ASPVEDRAFT_182223 [Aspergillus versicolor CBS 583.65]|uniref:Uncharacterized protein n=1 Tax=Aspergillus versicolor CBS 583.65 TaxID=1036611 RepID=A0A1L9P4Q0_ASPVE|nr:uncharacterized protein ASPVEDRAFT_182223 [Aspergillus versicolor CBS 583.65]OJI96501.1 hypothetical protein ASPVEDRAFT_182223 [Aspergillus versicolor CBS 583.65]